MKTVEINGDVLNQIPKMRGSRNLANKMQYQYKTADQRSSNDKQIVNQRSQTSMNFAKNYGGYENGF